MLRTGKVAFGDVRKASERIGSFVHRTPVLTCAALERLAGAKVYLKAENFQRTGSFKYRGATNAVRSLSDREADRGVATHSSGNHAQALALAARERGVPAYVVMPADAPALKRTAVEGYGAKVYPCEASVESRERTLKGVLDGTGARFIPSYDDERIIAGQGTAALELMGETGGLDAVIAPVGGGGLASGTAVACHGVRAGVQVVGAEPELADDAFRSLRDGRVQPALPPRTVADGLRMPLSELTFGILRRELERIVPVSDEEILKAVRLLFERAKIVVEPSGAAPLAALLRERGRFAGLRVGLILTGGNIDLKRLRDNDGTS